MAPGCLGSTGGDLLQQSAKKNLKRETKVKGGNERGPFHGHGGDIAKFTRGQGFGFGGEKRTGGWGPLYRV